VEASLQATGNSAMGRGSQGAVPLIVNFRSSDLELKEGQSMHWTLVLAPVR
jgi:hypothetical protein